MAGRRVRLPPRGLAMSTTQTAVDEWHGVYEYDRGDLLEDRSSRPDSEKLILTECPFCARDPTRPRYHFGEHESRPRHIRQVHGQDR